MRRCFVSSFVAVEISHDLSVDHQPFVRIDANAEQTRIGVDLKDRVSGSEIVKNAGTVKNGEIGHVLFFLEFGWIAIQNLGFWQRDSSSFAGFEVDFVSICGHDFGSDVNFVWICHPTIRLAIKRRRSLGHELFSRGLEPDPIWMLG